MEKVYKAELKAPNGASLDVAVKLVKKGAPAEETTKLLQEAANLGQFKHKTCCEIDWSGHSGRTSEFVAIHSLTYVCSYISKHMCTYMYVHSILCDVRSDLTYIGIISECF